MRMSVSKTSGPLSSWRLERWHSEKLYRAKAEECFQLAASAYTPLEKQAWQELGEDWLSLAAEVKETVIESSPTLAPEIT
jgi:hypothetical protein